MPIIHSRDCHWAISVGGTGTRDCTQMVWKTALEITTSAECQCTWDSGIVPAAHPLSATLYLGGEERMVVHCLPHSRGPFSIHLLISALYMCACDLLILLVFAYLSYLYFSYFLFYASYLLSYLFFYLLPSRIWTRSVSRPEVVGGDRIRV